MVAGANTPVIVDVGDSADITLMIPISGKCISINDGTEHLWQAHEAAMLYPQIGRGGHSSIRSTINLDLNADRLQTTAQNMLGLASDAYIDLMIDRARLVPLSYGHISFDAALRQLCKTVDVLSVNKDALSFSGIDEAFYRVVVMMLQPTLFLDGPDRGGKSHSSRQTLGPVCDYIRTHLDSPITLSALEKVAGMSRRSLQYSFGAHFGCSPMDWVRHQRLELARRRLMDAQPGASVTEIALNCGFTHLATFSRRYQQVFGEPPSSTLMKVLREHR